MPRYLNGTAPARRSRSLRGSCAVRSRLIVMVDRPVIRHNQSDKTAPDILADIVNTSSADRDDRAPEIARTRRTERD